MLQERGLVPHSWVGVGLVRYDRVRVGLVFLPYNDEITVDTQLFSQHILTLLIFQGHSLLVLSLSL